jgi:microtubule-associated protein-like 6
MLVSCGIKHINFWKLTGNTLEKKKGLFGQLKSMQTMFCVVFSKTDDIYYTGTTSGDIYVWKGQNLDEIISAAHDGPIYSMIPTSDGYITSAKDGKVRFWDAKFSPTTVWDLKASITVCNGKLLFQSKTFWILSRINFSKF